MSGEVKQRSSYWDNIKGFLMLLTVFAHILYQLQNNAESINKTVDCIYMFHMPAFVFVSGFFGKSERARSFAGIVKLLFLYFIFNSLMGFAYGFSSLLVPMYSFWYLPALAVWRLTAHRIAKFKEINLILFIVALFAGFFPSIDNTFSAARILCFYPFYMAGYQLSREKSEALTAKPYTKRLLTGIPAALLTAAGALAAYSFFSFSDSSLLMDAYPEPIGSFGRISIYVIAFLAIYALHQLSPDKKLPLLTTAGRNSLWIFILHRPLTLLLSDRIAALDTGYIFLIAAVAAVLICLLCGNVFLAKYLNAFAEKGTAIFTSDEKTKFNFSKLALLAVSLGYLVTVVLNAYAGFTADDLKKILRGEIGGEDEESENDAEQAVIWPVMTAQQKSAFDDAFRITFAGDLLLLEDQVKRGFDGEQYDFSDVFAYAEPYISSADLAVGVFEGPAAGPEAGYSVSNYDDGREVRLNFPDAFAQAVKDAGFDLVTTANNHVLDKGIDGAERTLDVLDRIGLDHTGSYRNGQEKQQNRVKLLDCQGIRIAVLSYTYGSNYINTEDLANPGGAYAYLTSVICGTEGEQFEELKASVEQDFCDAKALNPDLILVLPHIGTQFSNSMDDEQRVWFEIFKENGADIILGDHSHAVQPAGIETYNGKNVYTACCPGNFANIYRAQQGDTSMLTEVYIDRQTKSVIGGSIVPLYTFAPADGNFAAVPVYGIQNDPEIRARLTTDDIDRAADANAIITNVVFGHSMDISAVTERYYFNGDGFLRTKAEGPELTEQMKQGTLYQAMSRAESVCFIGDSVTEGTKNGGCPWYEPLTALFPDKTISNYSYGGCTVSYMTGHAGEIPEASLYVIALGTNDVRYRDASVCAMTAADYVQEIGALRSLLQAKSPDAEFVLIAPWYSTDGDPYCPLSFDAKSALNLEYSAALERYCFENNCGYLNANDIIRRTLTAFPERTYLLDHIHPNASKGVLLYTEAALCCR